MGITENERHGESNNNTANTTRDRALRESMSSIKQKFLVMSSKGGVGKTSVIVNLAMILSKKGVRVGLMDLNFQGPDIQSMLGLANVVKGDSDNRFLPIHYSDNLKVASVDALIQDMDKTGIWEKPLKISDIRRFISGVNWGQLDYLFVDTPPGPGEALPTVLRAMPDAKIIIVTAPNKIDADRAKKMINFFRNKKIQIFGWIENMRGFLCQHCGQPQELFGTGSSSRAIFLMNIPFLGRIPIDPHLGESIGAGQIFLEKYPSSLVADACGLIAQKILESGQ
jgi:Mrp family chromosome partitioning ATPase